MATLPPVDLLSAASVLTGTAPTTPHAHAPQVGAPVHTLDCRSCDGSGHGEQLDADYFQRCGDCNGTGVRSCDRCGCHEPAVLAACGNADYCADCGAAIDGTEAA